MVMIKNGKPVVPAEGNKQSKDIYVNKPDFYAGKKPKEMETKSVKIVHDENFSHQYRSTNDSVSKPSKNGFDEISRNGK